MKLNNFRLGLMFPKKKQKKNRKHADVHVKTKQDWLMQVSLRPEELNSKTIFFVTDKQEYWTGHTKSQSSVQLIINLTLDFERHWDNFTNASCRFWLDRTHRKRRNMIPWGKLDCVCNSPALSVAVLLSLATLPRKKRGRHWATEKKIWQTRSRALHMLCY